MEYFVKPGSIVREIWSDTDCILLIFGAASGEFALHKSVDWLFFTGKLPSDPIGRLFSTVVYAQKIIFEEKEKAEMTLQYMKNIHKNVENARGYEIPNWAYQDVLYMLIAYTISAYELLNHTLLLEEKEEVYTVFKEVGEKMGVNFLPVDFANWEKNRAKHLETNYDKSDLSVKLLKSYRNHLGGIQYSILTEVQKILLPKKLNEILFENKESKIHSLIILYKKGKNIWPISNLKYYLLAKKYRNQLKEIEKKI